jgi:hypothetical protein
MAVASLIIAIVGFNIKIEKAQTSGVELQGLTINVVLFVLVTVLIYHAIAFAIHAFEEYRNWELALVAKQATYWGGGVGLIELADQMKQAGDALGKIMANSGAITSQNQTILNVNDASNLKDLADSARIYANRLENFPKITRFRFWFWDIAVSAVVTSLAVSSYLWLPRGLFAGFVQ